MSLDLSAVVGIVVGALLLGALVTLAIVYSLRAPATPDYKAEDAVRKKAEDERAQREAKQALDHAALDNITKEELDSVMSGAVSVDELLRMRRASADASPAASKRPSNESARSAAVDTTAGHNVTVVITSTKRSERIG